MIAQNKETKECRYCHDTGMTSTRLDEGDGIELEDIVMVNYIMKHWAPKLVDTSRYGSLGDKQCYGRRIR